MEKRFGRALVVDDYVDVAAITARTLVLLGIVDKAEVASSGEVAWQKMSAAPFDLVIADLRLPGMDGLALLELIQSDHPTAQCVLMTGDDIVEIKRNARHSSIRHFVAKPFPVEILAAMIRTLSVDCRSGHRLEWGHHGE